MSTIFYFAKWKFLLAALAAVIEMDRNFQQSKANDKTEYDAIARLSGMLGEYGVLFELAMEILHNNEQVQKFKYMANIVNAIVNRILELKKQIGQVDQSTHHYLNAGLIIHHLTSFDAELTDIPEKIERSEDLDIIVKESFKNAEKQIARLAQRGGDHGGDRQSTEDGEGNDVIERLALSESDDEEDSQDMEVKHIEPVDLTRTYVNIIWATEKTRQVIRKINAKAIMKEKWVKELEGTANPEACPEIKAKAIILIRDSYRAYVKIKRRRVEEAKENDVLDICKQALPNHDAKKKNEDIWSVHAKKYKEYEKDFKTKMEEFQLEYRRWKSESIADDLRDMLRNWFKQWFNEIKYVQDIPTEKEGGTCLILNEEFLTPMQWLEKYNAFLSQKGKSSEKKKQEKEEKKREAQMKKKEEASKKRQEELLMKKMAKNPRLHPGYRYPVSEKTQLIAQAVQDYHRDWDYLDVEEDEEAKIKHCKHKMEEETFMEVFLAVLKDVDNEMREECKVLKSALKKDYDSNGIEFPKMALEGGKREKKKKLKSIKSENLPDKLSFLAMHKILREYPKLKLEDYVGDPNFVGDDLRELDKETKAYCGNTREEWWDHCLSLARGYSRTLLVGARGSGKRPMVHTIASINEAVLFEIDISAFKDPDSSSPELLGKLLKALLTCARAVQPSVIHIRDVHRLFYKKVPPDEAEIDFGILRKFFITKLLKGIQNVDKISVIGTCVNPWDTKHAKLLKQFNNLVMMPDTTYATTFYILQRWVDSNRAIPRDFSVSTLARELRGYSFGTIENILKDFLSGERVVKIAAKGLQAEEIFEFIMNNDALEKVEYEKYDAWYYDKTPWGHKEKKHMHEHKAFQEILAKYAEKSKKKSKSATSSMASSHMSVAR